jgi:2-aminoadipate transaminase
MRLNFSGVSEETIREGVRRIAEVVHEQLDLLRTIAGPPAAAEPPVGDALGEPEHPLADVLPLPRREGRAGRRDAR